MQKCVLIYDDDEEILTVCRAILQDKYRIVTKTDCDEVIQDVLDIKPDLVLMDLWIPRIGGEKAVQMLKTDEKTRNIPVLLFSANDETENASRRAKSDGFLKKPFDLAEFHEVIRDALTMHASQEQ